MGAIRILPDLLVNKIAAGEVIERPASVLKELAENALDAGASRLAVSVEDGGKQLIRVTDDGHGMTLDDLRLAVMPHATSKLACEDDLHRIISLGFRGEALPSIGSVSHVRIVSRRRGAVEGGEITVSGDRVEAARAAGCPEGTTVEVRDLFFNVPARRKFLRATSTESGHINEQFARLALAHPQVAFELTSNSRVVQKLPGEQSVQDRVAGLYGADLAKELIVIERNERDLVLEAYAAPPIQSRSTAAWQYIFVNGRFIRDRYIQHAVREAYRGLMEHDRQPVYFLFLTLPPDAIDVNVHPTKIEVRWRDSNLVHSQVLSAFRETFLRTDLTPALRTDRGRPPASPENQEAIRRQMAEMFRSAAPLVGTAAPPAFQSSAVGPQTRAWQETEGPTETGRLAGGVSPYSPITTHHSPDAGAQLWRSVYADAPSTSQPAVEPPFARRRPAIQLHNTYLVVESEDGMVIIDQHALHERVMYNQLCERMTAGPLESQRLLLPETLSLTPRELNLLQSNEGLLHQLGIEVSAFGPDAVAVQAFPALLRDTDVVPFMRDLLDKLRDQDEQGRVAHPETVIHELLDMMACKAAVKAGDPLTPDEIEALVAQRDLVEKSSNCPHGRPTTLRLTVRDLEKQFKRI